MSEGSVASGGAVGIRRIGQIALTARDTERAKEFYRDVLELKHLFDAPPGLTFFECGGVRLMLSPPEAGEHDHPSSIVYFDVADIMATHRMLVQRGVRFEGEPHRVADLGDRVLWLAFLRDTEGNMVALMSEVPKAAE